MVTITPSFTLKRTAEDEMLNLFDAIAGDPLKLCVKIAAYYGLRRSEVLGLRWI